jgi:hypothetical protein
VEEVEDAQVGRDRRIVVKLCFRAVGRRRSHNRQPRRSPAPDCGGHGLACLARPLRPAGRQTG